MSESLKKLIIICVTILISTVILSFSLYKGFEYIGSELKVQDETKYQVYYEGNKLIVFNSSTGEYWTKFEPNNQGPTYWKKNGELSNLIKND